MPPAWMAELSEEWIEPVEEDELVHSRSTSPQLDFGSLVINDIPLPSPSQASIDGHPDPIDNNADQQQEKSYQMGSILFSPSKKKTRSNAHIMDDGSSSASINYAPSPDQQLAMAAKAFNVHLLNQADDDDEQDENSFVVKSVPQAKLSMKPVRTPAKLQSLFMQPSPPPLSNTKQQQHIKVSSPRLAEDQDQDVQEKVQEQEQDLSKAIQHRDEEQPDGSVSLSLPSEPSSEQQEEGTQASFLIHQDLDEIPEPSLAEGEEEGSFVQHDERNARHSNAELDNQALSVVDEREEEGLEEVTASLAQSHIADVRSFVDIVEEEAGPQESQQEQQANPSTSHFPSTEFSFRVEPKSPPKLLSSYLEGVFSTPMQDLPSGESRVEVKESTSEQKVREETSDQGEEVSINIATSTPASSSRGASQRPSPSQQQQQHDSPNSNLPKASPALSIFKFKQDTYTRMHLQALVAEIEGLTSPPRGGHQNLGEVSCAPIDLSAISNGEMINDMLATSRRGMYRQNNDASRAERYDKDEGGSQIEQEHATPSSQTLDDEYTYHTAHIEQDGMTQTRLESPYQRFLADLHQDEGDNAYDQDDETGRIANTRSAKRVRLSASEYQPYRDHHRQNLSHHSPHHRAAEASYRNQVQFGKSSSPALGSPLRSRIQNRVMPNRMQSPAARRGLASSAGAGRRMPYSALSASRLRYSVNNVDRSIADLSTASAKTARTSSPIRPPLRSLPPMTAPVRRTYRSSQLREAEQTSPSVQEEQVQTEVPDQDEQEESTVPPLETPPSRWRHEGTIGSVRRQTPQDQHGKTPAHVVQGRLQEAKALMERIRLRNVERHGLSPSTAGSATTDNDNNAILGTSSAVLLPGSSNRPIIAITPDAVDVGTEDEATSYIGNPALKRKPMTRQGTFSRPPNPTPSTAALAHQLQRSGRVVTDTMAIPGEEAEHRTSEVVKSASTVQPEEVSITPTEEKADSLAPLPNIGQQNNVNATSNSIRRQLSASPVVRQSAQGVFAGSPAPSLQPSSFTSSSKRTFQTAPVSRYLQQEQQQYLQSSRHPPSLMSHTSSDRFFTSTSSRYVSGSTAPTSLIASSIGTAKGAQVHARGTELKRQYGGLVNIPPDEVENLLTEDVLGDMVFDNTNKKWVKIDKYLAAQRQSVKEAADQQLSPARVEGPALSPIEEQGPDEETTADDPFRDITGFESSKSRTDLTTQSSSSANGNKSGATLKHNRSGSLVMPLTISQAASQKNDAEDDRHTEKTSTPLHQNLQGSVAPPFVSPDMPSIPQVPSGQAESRSSSEAPQIPLSTSASSSSEELRNASRRSSGATSVPPKSVLKRSDANAFSTPLPSSKLLSRINSKQTRSVSFSDGKIPGRGDSLDAKQAKMIGSALRNEVQHGQTSAAESALLDGDDQPEASRRTIKDVDDDTISLNAYTSTVTRGNEQPYNASRSDSARHIEHDTPTAVYHAYSKPRSLRLKPRGPDSMANSMVSTTSTLAWHRKPLNANATILTECSFGVSYDRLLRVLTDVVPFEPSWKDLVNINLRERGLDSVVRLKEFLPNLDEINLSDNNIAYLTGLPTSLRFLSLANNRLGDISSFTYLTNLETLDISGNTAITSIRQLSCLQHLRSLKADGCGIGSIEGIDQLDGLVSLGLSNNSISDLRLENTAWTRLENLDASDNNILDVSGVESLPALRALNLDYNSLQDFVLAGPCASLRILKISNNSLDSLDLAQLPNIRTVFADYNRITNLSGTSKLRKLENLSLREQRQGSIDFPVKDLRDIRRLYLSYNPLPDAFSSEHFFNLTLLELSGCRLTTLPTDFSAVVPNCRVLVLDNNFLTSLAPISGAKRLRALSAVGNRLEKVKDLLGIWHECTELEMLDLRLNPMTLGFYASPNLSVAPPNLNLIPTDNNVSLKTYKAIDTQHRLTLPNEWLARRTAYRALVIEAAPSLKLLDGLKVGHTQRQRARDLIEKFAS